MLSTIPSCGLALLQGPEDAFDYVVTLTDGVNSIPIYCHRCVLLVHSKKIREYLCNENYFSMDIKVQSGYLGAAIELIQYMYLKDPSLLSDKEKILDLCGFFEMPFDFLVIRNDEAQILNRMQFVYHLHFQQTQESCVVGKEFLQCLEIRNNEVKNVEYPHEKKRKAPQRFRRKQPRRQTARRAAQAIRDQL